MINRESFKCPGKEFRPDVRWWLAEGLHTDETLKNDLRLLDESGFGAVEFLAMDEPGADSKIYGWGSEEWVHDSSLMFEETTKRGLGVSATCGTNWSNCNLISITPDDKAAAKELDYCEEILEAGSCRDGKIPECELFMPGVTKQDLIAAVAVREDGENGKRKYLAEKSAVVLTGQIKDGELSWTAPGDGTWHLFYFYIHGTGQTANPSVSVSYTVNYIDHYGIDAFKEYWDSEVLTPELKETIRENGRAMMYMDSLELCTFSAGGQLWGYNFLSEFSDRRGYDLTPYLPLVIKKPGGMMQADFTYYYHSRNALFLEKLYNDLYQTMTDMYMENMMKPMQEWCHSNKMTLRSEISYGLPFEISQPGKYVDGIETESLEFASQIESYRNLAGPAHIYNRTYSSETGATRLNYMMGLDFYTQIIYTQFAAGVSKTVLHGYSSIAGSEESTYWPGHEGMWPMFSERFGVRQPAFRHYNDWTGMLARYQYVLRQGKPRVDLGILRLDYNFNNMLADAPEGEKEFYEHGGMRAHKGMYWKDMKLQDAGYTWDYFAPQILEENFTDISEGLLYPDGPGYQALVIYQGMMPVRSAEKILKLAEKGLPILFVNGVTEEIRPMGISRTYEKAAAMTPFNDGKDEELAAVIDEIKRFPNVKEISDQSKTLEALYELEVHPRAEFVNPCEKVLTAVRQDENNIILYVYNMQYTEKASESFKLAVNGTGKPYRLDCWSGDVSEVGCFDISGCRTELDITLAPGEARLYLIEMDEDDALHAVKSDGCKVMMKNGILYASSGQSGEFEILLSDGSKEKVSFEVPESINLEEWDLKVEDWNEGDKITLTEDRGLGIKTVEVYYETRKDIIEAGRTALKSWKDIPAVGPEVSGVGYYKSSFTAPADWDSTYGAVLDIESTNENSVAVYVNGIKAHSVDMQALSVDISGLVRPGENEVTVEVSTTLNNRLLSRGYYDKVAELSQILAESANNAIGFESDADDDFGLDINFGVSTDVRDYGMVGRTQIIFYRTAKL